MTEFSSVKYITARKQHVCCECRGPIFKGDSYEKYFIVSDYCSDYKTCYYCVIAREWLTKSTDWPNDVDGEGHSFFFGMLRDHLLEQAREGDVKFKWQAYRAVVRMDKRKLK